jgi:ABC-type spermidine/putrescine transport system permease subunit II
VGDDAPGTEAADVSRGRTGRWAPIVIAVSLVFLYGPIVLIALLSLNDSSVAALPMRGVTLHWYDELFADERFRDAGVYSLQLGIVSTVIAVVIGTAGALGISRGRATRWSSAVGSFWTVPLLVPALVLSVALASAFRLLEARLSFWTLVAGHVVVNAPLVYLLVLARLRGFDWTLVQAARTLGADTFTAFRRVTLPLLAPAIIGGAVLSFAISLDNFVVSLFLTGGRSTLPLLIWSMMREGFSPTANALATLLLVGTLVAAVLAERLATRQPARRPREAVAPAAQTPLPRLEL